MSKDPEKCQAQIRDHLISRIRSYARDQGYKIELVAACDSDLPSLLQPMPPGLQDVVDRQDTSGFCKVTLLPAMWLQLDANPFLLHDGHIHAMHSHGKYALNAISSYSVTEA